MRLREWLGFAPPILPASPFNGPSDIVQLTIDDLFGDALDTTTVTVQTALRVPGLKRAKNVHCGLVAGLPFKEFEVDALVDPQPEWLYRTSSAVSPYHRMFGIVEDLFWYGWALLGAELGDDDLPADAIHIPQGFWSVDSSTGNITVDRRIDKRYTQRLIAIPLGGNGVLTDGLDTIRAARNIERAWQDRIANPTAQTELHITDGTEMSRKQKLQLAKDYNAGRALPGGATSVTPTNIEVRDHGTVEASMFDQGRNSVRLDLANHAMVPASIIEGAKNGSAGEINYSNETGKRDELYDFGTSLFVNAIQARLSMDDVCAVGHSIRADLTNLMTVPTPNATPAVED